MKNLKSLLFLFLAAYAAAGCRKLSTPEPAQGTPVSNQMIAVVDGQPWVALNISAIRTATAFTITGTSKDGKSITLYIENELIGQKDIGAGQRNFGSFVDDSTQASYKSNAVGGEGHVTFTGLDESAKIISGRFDFTGVSAGGSTVHITDGQFIRVPYTGGSSGAAKDMSGKVDGVAWSADNVFAVAGTDKITITGFQNNNTSITLTMPAGITGGTYDITMGGTYAAQYMKNSTDVLQATAGTLIITEHNPGTKTIKGTFSFEAEVPGNPDINATVSEGNFTVVYD
jgi:hypothetical protein